jgi:hypothetical protein
MLPTGILSSSFASLIAAGSDYVIEVARIDCAWPTHKDAILESELLARDCGVLFDLAPIWPGFLSGSGARNPSAGRPWEQSNCRISSQCSNLDCRRAGTLGE